jgi:hypothetical protein
MFFNVRWLNKWNSLKNQVFKSRSVSRAPIAAQKKCNETLHCLPLSQAASCQPSVLSRPLRKGQRRRSQSIAGG